MTDFYKTSMKRAAFLTPREQKRPKFMPKPQTCPELSNKDSVSVYCRIRPLDDPSEDPFAYQIHSRTVKLTPPISSFAFRNGSAKEQQFRFHRVFPSNSSQKDLYESVAKPLIVNLLNGKNGLLFVYGITGSGKTYTMEGTRRDGGILRRTIDTIFSSISEYQTIKYVFKPDRMNGFEAQSEADAMSDRQRLLSNFTRMTRRQNKKEQSSTQSSISSIEESSKIAAIFEDNGYAVFVNYIEIYNNYVYDLLEEFSDNKMTKDLQSKILREDARRNMYVHGCTEVEVKSPEEALEVLAKGQKRRKVAYTKLNLESSRSHSVFTVRVVQAPHDAQGDQIVTDKSAIVVSQLSMVDLAGSERNNRTKATGDRIKEAGNINNSLMALRQCIETLRENQQNRGSKKVPYRDSKLTHFFKNYFEGEGKVNMVVCVNPRHDDYDETLPVMKFAELASEVQIHLPSSNVRPDFGFTPGRRRANQVFKEARRRIDEEFKAKELDTVDTLPVYSLGPSLSPLNFSTTMELGDCLQNGIAFFNKRRAIKEKFVAGVKEEELKVRKIISDIEKENIHFRQENSSYASLYEDAMRKLKYMEGKLLNAEASTDTLHRKFADYNSLIDEHRQACEERDLAKSQGLIEKQKMKTKLKLKLETERDKMIKDVNCKLREQKSQLKARMYETQVKALQEMFDCPESGRSTGLRQPNRNMLKAAKSEESLIDATNTAAPNVISTPKFPRHKRSLSQGANVRDLWIDHRPDQVVEPGTVLQPNMPRRKSVRRLRSGDLLDSKRISHYCLTTQGQDTSGEIETKMYKGDVLPTAGGGAQVIFHDVEILKQKDPLNVSSGKRGSDGTPKVDSVTLQSRCASGIVGRTSRYISSSKRLRK